MYWKAQRIHEAVTEAQELLKRDPNDLKRVGEYIAELGTDLERATEMAARDRTVQRGYRWIPRTGVGVMAGAVMQSQ